MARAQQINQAGSPPRPARKFSGTFILLGIGILVAVVLIAGMVVSQLRWNTLLTRVEPSDHWQQITKDFGSYWKRNRRLPADLTEGEKLGWKWVAAPVISRGTGGSSQGTRTVSRIQYRQYEYMYARLDEETAIMWAVPLWNTPASAYREPDYLNAVTGHNEELVGYLEELKKQKRTWLVVFYGGETRAWAGVLEQNKQPSTFGLEANLEPSGDWLKKNNLFETFGEKWINNPAANENKKKTKK